jgi:hypothetical protein
MKKTFASLAVSLLCVSAWSTPILDPANGEYYDVVQDLNVPWLIAEQQALTMNFMGLEGHLVTITSGDEDTFVGNLIHTTSLPGGGEVWAGGYQNPANPASVSNPQAGWTWVNNEGTFPGVNSVSPYANWNNGEPNDFYGAGTEQYLGLNLGTIGGFNDEGDLDFISGYVIEYDPNTIPGGGLVPDGGSTAGLLTGALTMLGIAARRLRK